MTSPLVRLRMDGLGRYLATRASMRLRYLLTNRFATQRRRVRILTKEVELDPGDIEQYYLLKDCIREPENLFVYRAIAARGLCSTFVDVGANYGHVAASVAGLFPRLILIEPNPEAVAHLQAIFSGNDKVRVVAGAIAPPDSAGETTLAVPVGSSGLGSVQAIGASQEGVRLFKCKALFLAEILKDVRISDCYIKIDVEGAELAVLRSAEDLIKANRPIVGYEALSRDRAVECAQFFDNYVHYCARFDFVDHSGALSRSLIPLLRACISGGSIVVLRLEDLATTDLENFSQVFSVPREKSGEFERALTEEASRLGHVWGAELNHSFSR